LIFTATEVLVVYTAALMVGGYYTWNEPEYVSITNSGSPPCTPLFTYIITSPAMGA